jgi:hypothetical protein
MKLTWQKRITIALVAANASILILYVSGWTYPRAQHREKAIKELPYPNQPAEIVNIKVKGKAIKSNEKFEGESDWLKNVTFEVKNVSKKPITFIRVDIDFPETRATGRLMLHQIFLGQNPEATSTLGNVPLHLMPEKSLKVSLVSQHDRIERLLKLRYPSVENMNEINIALGDAIFDDGTAWSGGNIFKRNPDPNSPRKWIIVTDGQGTN